MASEARSEYLSYQTYPTYPPYTHRPRDCST